MIEVTVVAEMAEVTVVTVVTVGTVMTILTIVTVVKERRKKIVMKFFCDDNFLWWKKSCEDFWIKKKNIARLQNAALSTSYWLSRCQVVLTKILLKVLSETEFCQELSFVSKFSFLSLARIWVFEM